MSFRPRIVGFVCNWSLPPEVGAPSGARIQGYPRIRIVRVACVGRIDPVIMLETFAQGADGVLIIGCNPPDCHYSEGNLQVDRAVAITMGLFRVIGLESERIMTLWFSDREKRDFGHSVKEFSEQVEKLGPSPLNDEKRKPEIMVNMLAAKGAASDFRLRAWLGREKELIENANVYGEKTEPKEFGDMLDDAIETEFIRHKILLLTKRPLSVKDLSNNLNMKPSVVFRHILNLRRKGMLTLAQVEETTPMYKAVEA